MMWGWNGLRQVETWSHTHYCYWVGRVVHHCATHIIDRCRSDDGLLGGKHDGLVHLRWKWRVVPLWNRTAALSSMGVAVSVSWVPVITRQQPREGINTKWHVSGRHGYPHSVIRKVMNLLCGTTYRIFVSTPSWDLEVEFITVVDAKLLTVWYTGTKVSE